MAQSQNLCACYKGCMQVYKQMRSFDANFRMTVINAELANNCLAATSYDVVQSSMGKRLTQRDCLKCWQFEKKSQSHEKGVHE